MDELAMKFMEAYFSPYRREVSRELGAGIQKEEFPAFKQRIERNHRLLVDSLDDFNPIPVPMETIDPNKKFFLEPRFQQFKDSISWRNVENKVLPMFLASAAAIIQARFISWYFFKDEVLNLPDMVTLLDKLGYKWKEERYSRRAWLRLSIKFFERFVPRFYGLQVKSIDSMEEISLAVPVKKLPVVLVRDDEDWYPGLNYISLAIVGWTDDSYFVYDPYNHSENIQQIPFKVVNPRVEYGWIFSE